MDAGRDGFFKSLKGLIESITVVNTILRDDLELFSTNKIDELQQSNAQKQIILHNIAGFAHDLQQYMSQHEQDIPQHEQEFIPSLKGYLNLLTPSDQVAGANLLSKLQEILTESTRNLATNNSVVMSNLDQIKDFWDSLALLAADNNAVYEKPKHIEKS